MEKRLEQLLHFEAAVIFSTIFKSQILNPESILSSCYYFYLTSFLRHPAPEILLGKVSLWPPLPGAPARVGMVLQPPTPKIFHSPPGQKS